MVEPNSQSPEEEIIFNLSDAAASELVPAGSRVFSLAINGLPVLTELNLARTHGPLRAAEYRFRLHTKKQKGIHLTFLPIEGEPVLSGIQVRPVR